MDKNKRRKQRTENTDYKKIVTKLKQDLKQEIEWQPWCLYAHDEKYDLSFHDDIYVLRKKRKWVYSISEPDLDFDEGAF